VPHFDFYFLPVSSSLFFFSTEPLKIIFITSKIVYSLKEQRFRSKGQLKHIFYSIALTSNIQSCKMDTFVTMLPVQDETKLCDSTVIIELLIIIG
jgi:hypothetical protein